MKKPLLSTKTREVFCNSTNDRDGLLHRVACRVRQKKPLKEENTTEVDNSDGTTESNDTPKEPVYTVTNAEYMAERERLTSPSIINDNFTWTINGMYKQKIDNGKCEFMPQGDHAILNFDPSTYDETAKIAKCDQYGYDPSKKHG